jgi:hypothetical protein
MPGEQLLKALDHVWRVLTPLNLPMAVMGGIAVSVWQHARSTRDVDVLIQMAPSDTDQIAGALGQAGIHPRRFQPLLNLDEQHVLMLFYQPPGAFFEIKIDLLYAELDYQKQALMRRIPVQLPGLESTIFVLSCEDLILHKLMAGRIIDKADCAFLVRVNRQELDVGYLQTWIDRLSLTEKWLEIWREAFPGEESIISRTPP